MQLDRALKMINSGMTVSLGGGQHVQMLADVLKNDAALNVEICSPSDLTRQYCRKLGLKVIPGLPEHIDIAFDGCDSVDKNLRLLKSNGGIHTLEKAYANVADTYVILTQSTKVHDQLDTSIPLCIEIVAACVPQILSEARKCMLKASVRTADKYMGFVRTGSGNQLIDCYAESWAEINTVAKTLKQLNGVVSTSYFPDQASVVLAENEDGSVTTIKKGEQK